MTKKQLWVIYTIVVFLMVWGIELINTIKYKKSIGFSDIFNPFSATQIIYITSSLLLTRYVFRRYYAARQYTPLLAAIIGVGIFFIILRYITEEIIAPVFFGFSNYSPNTPLTFYALDNIYYAVMYIVMGFLIFLLDNQVGAQKKEVLLLQQNRQAELAFLRSQVSPHFLFNSLNNIYSLSYKKSDKAPAAILKLSELMRYMLYEKETAIMLLKEWAYVQNFISLQQLRYDYPVYINVQANGNLEEVNIAPYLLIPFVENAFKHGNFSDAAMPLQINLSVKENSIHFIIENKISKQQKDSDGGIGLTNVKRRLALLYPGQHLLNINCTKETFHIHLHINNIHGIKNSSAG